MSDKEDATEKVNCQFVFKKSNRRNNNVKKKIEVSSTDSDEADESNVIVPQSRKKAFNPMVQSTSSSKNIRSSKRKGDESSSSEEEEDEQLRRNKLFKVAYESSKTGDREGSKDMGATSTFDLDTDKAKDARTQYEKTSKIEEELKNAPDVDNVYRGLANYHKYTEKKDTIEKAASTSKYGPMRAPDNIRSTVRWDYQPDICKDYKETGFCGFGDSCKFLHDRSDYKAGWQLEKEHEAGNNGGEDEDDDKYRITEEDDDLPFACLICRESFVNPVVTKCKHYFCEKCAIAHYRKSTKCAVCGQQTMGVFNIAKEIVKKMEKMKNEEASDHEAGGNEEDDES